PGSSQHACLPLSLRPHAGGIGTAPPERPPAPLPWGEDAVRESGDGRLSDAQHRSLHPAPALGIPREALPFYGRHRVRCRRGTWAEHRRRSDVRVGTPRHLRGPLVARGLAPRQRRRRAVQLLRSPRAEGAGALARGGCRLMARSVIPLWDIPSLPVHGTEAVFPIRRVHCVGRNYAEHAREMGGDPDREPPFFFAKPADAVVPNGGEVPYPPQTQKLAYEMELVVAIGKGGA